MKKYLERPREEKKEIVEDFYKPKSKPMPILKYIDRMNSLYSNSEDPKYIDPKEMEDIKKTLPVSEMVKQPKKKNVKVAGIKDSSLYKLLENPKVLGVELGHDTIMNVIDVIRNSGLVKKPVKVEPKKEIDHIAILSNGDEFIV